MAKELHNLRLRIGRDGCIQECNFLTPGQPHIPSPLFLGKNVSEVLPEEVAAAIMASLDTALTQGWHEATISVAGPQGALWSEISMASIVNPQQPQGDFILRIRDITARKQSEEQLRVSEQRHRFLAENARDVVWTMAADGRVTYVSPAIQKVRGYTPEEAMRQTFDETHPPQSQAISLGYLQKLQADLLAGRTPENFLGDLEYKCKDGSTFWTEVRVFPVLGDDGQLVELVGLTRDIAERKRNELETAHYLHDLEVAVTQRTHALLIAKDAAEAASRAKTTFLANMSHELRTPMNAIMGLTDLVLRKTTEPKLRDQLGKIHKASHHLLGVINDILDISKIEAERMTLEQAPLQVGDIMDNVTSLMAHRFTEKGLLLQVDLPAALARRPLLGDALRLGQILLNLTGNAVKFTDRGHVVIHVQRMEQDVGLERLRFSVEDTGAGLSLAMQSEAFDGFVRGDHELVGEHAGAGLGLSICQRLVKLMGGEMGVESVPGQGSTFWFTVRLKAQSQIASAQESGVSSIMAAQAMAGLRILLVDDNHSIREIVKQLLQLAQVRVDTAENGVEALAMLKDTRYDLVLMDLQMPVMGGLEATRRIRQDPALAKLPIVALTAGGLASELDQLKADGITDYLGKPFDYQKLLEVLSRNVPTAQLQQPV